MHFRVFKMEELKSDLYHRLNMMEKKMESEWSQYLFQFFIFVLCKALFVVFL